MPKKSPTKFLILPIISSALILLVWSKTSLSILATLSIRAGSRTAALSAPKSYHRSLIILIRFSFCWSNLWFAWCKSESMEFQFLINPSSNFRHTSDTRYLMGWMCMFSYAFKSVFFVSYSNSNYICGWLSVL